MSNEKVTDLPSVTNATLADIIYAVQSGISVQENLSQVFQLFLGNNVLNYSGNPNGNLAGTINQFCYDTADMFLYLCTTSGSSSVAVWTLVGANVLRPANGGTGVASPTADTLPIAQGASSFSFLGPPTNGQVLIGSTGNTPVLTTLTAGANVTITNSPGQIVIQSTGVGSFSWNVITGSSANMTANNGYIANKSTLVSLALPASSSIGDVITVIGEGSGGWSITQGASQQIIIGSSSSTSGAGGSVSSSNQHDALDLVCIAANDIWIARNGVQGNLTIV